MVLEPGNDPRDLVRGLGLQARHVYDSVLHGFAADLTPAQPERVRRVPAVASTEADQVVRADATQRVAGLYGLDRTDQRALPLSGTYTCRSTTSTVKAHVIDTGIATGHADFGGRAQNVYDASGQRGADCHGTHVAGTLGGTTHGIAKGVRLLGVRVLDCSGSGANSGVIAGLDWVRTHATGASVADLSLSSGYSPALNRAAADLAASGVFVAVAAGNTGSNACHASPSSASAVFTVAASDRTDTRASFSNNGSCVDAYAPGVGIISTWLTGTRTLSGTSMAGPHVAGVAALSKATNGQTASATLGRWLKDTATPSRIRGNPTGTPDRLLFNGL